MGVLAVPAILEIMYCIFAPLVERVRVYSGAIAESSICLLNIVAQLSSNKAESVNSPFLARYAIVQRSTNRADSLIESLYLVQ